MQRTPAGLFRGLAALAVLLVAVPAGAAEQDSDSVIALSLAEMLRAARTVVSNNQDRINDPKLGDKGLTAEVVVAEAIDIYKKTTGTDPMALDPASRHGRLLRAQIEAIAEVTNAHQATINAPGVGFKGFIPAR
jgi:ketopantoate hydroxymethyltransferase